VESEIVFKFFGDQIRVIGFVLERDAFADGSLELAGAFPGVEDEDVEPVVEALGARDRGPELVLVVLLPLSV